MKYFCTLPNFQELDEKFDLTPMVNDKKVTYYANQIGVLKGQIRVRDNTIVRNTLKDDQTLQELRKLPGIIEHPIHQLIDDKLESMLLICVPYTPETASIRKPTCNKEAKNCHVTIEVTLVEDTYTRTFTLGFWNTNLSVLEIIKDCFEDFYANDENDASEWRRQVECDEPDSVLFHYLERSIEYDAGIAVDYYDEIGNDSIVTYPNGDAILEHIQNIRVLNVQYN